MATIRKRGAKWQVQVRRAGHRSQSRSFHVLKDAEAWARQVEVQADRSELPGDPKVLHRITLGELVERYRDTVSVGKRGYEVERIVLTAFLRHPICCKRLSEISTESFASYRDERLKTIKWSTLKRELSPLHNLFEIAKGEWRFPLRENPLNKLKLKPTFERRERRLRDGELQELLKAAQSCRNKLIEPIILVALTTAMRRGEILRIRWQHIDFERGSLLIPQTKNGLTRTIPITKDVMGILKAVHVREDRVFPLTSNAFRLAWDRVRIRAGIRDFHFHDFRHEAISRFFERGLSVPEVALISGHRDARMLFRYAHASRKEIIKKLDCA